MMLLDLKNYNGIKIWMLVFLVASLPFYISLSSISIISAALLSVTIYLRGDFHFKNIDSLSLLFIGYYIIELIGLIYTQQANVTDGLSTLEKHHPMILLPIIFYNFHLHENDQRKLLLTFAAACIFASFICVIVNIYLSVSLYNTLFHEWRFSHDRVSEPIGLQAVYFAMYLSFAFLIFLNEIMAKRSVSTVAKNILGGFILLYVLVIIVALGARTITVTLLISLVVYVFMKVKKISLNARILLAAILTMAFLLIIFLNPVVRTRFIDMLHMDYQNSDYGSYFARWKIWEPGLEVVKDNIWFGVGTGDHQTELDKKFVEYEFMEGVQVFNMHNQYLQTMLNFGIFGLAVLLSILYTQFKESLRTEHFLYLSFLILFAGACMTESLLSRNKGIIFFLIFSFIFFKTRKQGNRIVSPD